MSHMTTRASRPKGTPRTPRRRTSGSSGSSGTPGVRLGRRPGPSTTRADILDAARRQFARAGYDQGSLRGIAREADVDPSLIIQLFGSKEGVFRTLIEELGATMTQRITELPTLPGTFGERLARLYYDTWQAPETRDHVLAIVRSVGSNDVAVNVMGAMFQQRVFPMLREHLGSDDLEPVMAPIAAQLIGTAISRYVLDIPFMPRTTDELVAMSAPIVDSIIAGAGFGGPEASGSAGNG